MYFSSFREIQVQASNRSGDDFQDDALCCILWGGQPKQKTLYTYGDSSEVEHLFHRQQALGSIPGKGGE